MTMPSIVGRGHPLAAETRSHNHLHTVQRRKAFVANSPHLFPLHSSTQKKMHDKGYVHGDIRAFNTVFGEEETKAG
jgi:tRNA A-37 threonylcarbamoyl transferase component Bud32